MIKLRAARPCVFGATSVIPIERVSVKTGTGPLGPWLSARKEPVAAIICDHRGCHAVDMTAQGRSLDEFVREIPELGPLLQQCRAGRRPQS